MSTGLAEAASGTGRNGSSTETKGRDRRQRRRLAIFGGGLVVGLVGGVAGGFLVGDFRGYARGNDEGFQKGDTYGRSHCIGDVKLVPAFDMALSNDQAANMARLAMSPVGPNATSDELKANGYTDMHTAVTSGPVVVEIFVPIDSNNPPADKDAMDKLLRPAAELTTAFKHGHGLTDGDDYILTPEAGNPDSGLKADPPTAAEGQPTQMIVQVNNLIC
jgi:hypothetical protein